MMNHKYSAAADEMLDEFQRAVCEVLASDAATPAELTSTAVVSAAERKALHAAAVAFTAWLEIRNIRDLVVAATEGGG